MYAVLQHSGYPCNRSNFCRNPKQFLSSDNSLTGDLAPVIVERTVSSSLHKRELERLSTGGHYPNQQDRGDISQSDSSVPIALQTPDTYAKRQRTAHYQPLAENLQSKDSIVNDADLQLHEGCVEPARCPSTAVLHRLSTRTCPTLAARFPHLVRPPEQQS